MALNPCRHKFTSSVGRLGACFKHCPQSACHPHLVSAGPYCLPLNTINAESEPRMLSSRSRYDPAASATIVQGVLRLAAVAQWRCRKQIDHHGHLRACRPCITPRQLAMHSRLAAGQAHGDSGVKRGSLCCTDHLELLKIGGRAASQPRHATQ